MCLALHNSPSPRGLGGLPPSLAPLLTAGCQPAAHPSHPSPSLLRILALTCNPFQERPAQS